jgi:hypothetical protein
LYIPYLTGIKERQNVGVGELGRDLDLAEEALWPDGTGHLGLEHLDGDRAAVPQIFGKVYRSHPAAAEFALDHVAVAQGASHL